MNNTSQTYAGIPEELAQLETAKIALIPVPYDGTSTWIKGADKGPDAFLEASENMELYDIETDSEVYLKGIYLTDAVTENESPEKMVDAVHQAALSYLKQGKFVTLFGGEHSISIGSIRAFREHFGEITVVQIDAHADLRPTYHGSACNHACALYESSKKDNLIQIGIRSMDIEETAHTNYDQCYFAHEIVGKKKWIKKAVNQCTDKVFVTIDLDAFDSGIMPGTGTPEPGGLDWHLVMKFLKKLAQNKQIVGFDIVELAPLENNKSSNFLAAKLYYKLLSFIFKYNTEHE